MLLPTHNHDNVSTLLKAQHKTAACPTTPDTSDTWLLLLLHHNNWIHTYTVPPCLGGWKQQRELGNRANAFSMSLFQKACCLTDALAALVDADLAEMARAYVHSTLCVLLLVVAAVATPVSDTTMMGTLEVQASPASATGEAVVELLRSLRPSIVAIQFRGSAGEALQLASQWLDVGFGDGYTAFIPVDLVEDGAQYVTGIVYRSELQVRCS